MDLNNVYWLGGSQCSGKTTISNKFKDIGVQIIHTDDIVREIPNNKPYIGKLRNESYEGVMKKTHNEITETFLGIYAETFEVVKSYVLKLNTNDKIIVEGVCLLPDLLFENNVKNVCYLLWTNEFYEKMYGQYISSESESEVKYKMFMKSIKLYIENNAQKFGYKIIYTEENSLENNTKLISKLFKISYTVR